MANVLSVMRNELFLEQSHEYGYAYKESQKKSIPTFNDISINRIDDWYNSIVAKYDVLNDLQISNLQVLLVKLKSILRAIDPNRLNINNCLIEENDLMLWRESTKGISKIVFNEYGQLVYMFNGNSGKKRKGVFESDVDIEKLLYRFISL